MVSKLARCVEERCPESPAAEFMRSVYADPWDSLELMDRMRKLADCLRDQLPDEYPEALGVILSIAPMFEGFDSLVFPDFVQRYGVEHPDESIPALQLFTELCTSEFAVRPFIERYPERMFKQLKEWARSENHHHRRLASEGCRPRLPWASALRDLKRDPSPIFPILEILKEDPELYVRRSVANNLNDISKDHPDQVVDLIKRWKGSSHETDWIVKHASRTMLKQGRTDVLELFGFASPEGIKASSLEFDATQIDRGESIVFKTKVRTLKNRLGKLRLEYAIHFVKKNGSTSIKVFQITEREESASEIDVRRKHSFKDLSTRKHFPGSHLIELRINGVVKASGTVELVS